nr:MAG TPA: hypothetical protein [Caudoviricetes sp.]
MLLTRCGGVLNRPTLRVGMPAHSRPIRVYIYIQVPGGHSCHLKNMVSGNFLPDARYHDYGHSRDLCYFRCRAFAHDLKCFRYRANTTRIFIYHKSDFF